MLPAGGEVLKNGFSEIKRPSRTFAMQRDQKTICGYVDGLEAVRQAIYCILNTERYDWLIYSWNYGIEMKDQYGKPMPYVKAKIKRRIEEALMQDDRITGVDAFTLESRGRKLSISFTVHTALGDVSAEKEVEV